MLHPSPRMNVILRSITLGCSSPNDADTPRYPKVKFGVTLSQAFKHDILPEPLSNIFIYIAREGVATTDLFRRPGNPRDIKRIEKRLSEGKQVLLTNYNFYTLASVIKKFLIKLPGGPFGPEGEAALLDILDLTETMDRYEKVNSYISNLPRANQQLISLLFGTWFRIINHSEITSMSGEALAKSVTGSMFHTCRDDPAKVAKAAKVMQFLVENFAVANMFGRTNIQYYVDSTRSGIHVVEKYKYEYKYPGEELVPRQKSLKLFSLILQAEAKKRGFHVQQDAVTQEEFYSKIPRTSNQKADTNKMDAIVLSRPPVCKRTQGCESKTVPVQVHTDQLRRAHHAEDKMEKVCTEPPKRRPVSHSVSGGPPSPTHRDTAPFLSPTQQQYLHNATSLSAPDVNHIKRKLKKKSSKNMSPQRPATVAKCVNEKHKTLPNDLDMRRMYATKSLGRFDLVRKRQLTRMRKRSDWFLNQSNGSMSMDNDSEYSDFRTSRDISLGKGISETGTSDAGFSDADSVFTEEQDHDRYDRCDTPASEPARPCMRPPKIQVDNTERASHINNMHEHLSDIPFTELEERYFVKETWYNPKKNET